MSSEKKRQTLGTAVHVAILVTHEN